jgi:selenocysteine-specific elongation factor
MSHVRRNIMLGTAGHVDHGKTALVKLLTGCETDTLAEEKQRGLTIDLGFAPCRLADERIVGLVDVPGHVDFIRNMVAGAQGIDVVILVVAADDGVMPQTLEHLHILTLMGLRHGLVALTKVDLVDGQRRESVMRDLRQLLVGTFLADAPICPISNVTGEGFDGFFETLNEVVGDCEDRPCHGWFRTWVEDVFTIRGAGTVITGIPTSGRARLGDRLHLLPTGLSGHIRRMQVYGEDATEGRTGECVALNLPELDHRAVRRGLVLSESDSLAAVTMAEAELRILDGIKGNIEDYLEVQLHAGTAAVSANVAMLEEMEMTGGQKQMVQLRLAEPLALVPGERFVVRANLPNSGVNGVTTIGGGQILGVGNARLRRRKQWTLEALGRRRDALGNPVRWCELMLRESPTPLTAGDLQMKCVMHAEEIVPLLRQLRADGRAIATDTDAWLHRDVIERAATAALDGIRGFHASNPQRAGIGREELLAKLNADPALFNPAVEWLLQTKQVERSGDFLAQAGWSARLVDRDHQLCEQISEKLKQSGCSPLTADELAQALAESPARVRAMIQLLVERGVLVRLDERVVMHRDAVEAGKQVAVQLFTNAPTFSTMKFRDTLGVSRKFAVPLLDYLDKIRFTVRSGHDRSPGTEAKKLAPRDAALAKPK